MRTLLDLLEETLKQVGSANGFPVCRRKSIEGEGGIQVALQAGDSGRIESLVLEHKGGHVLVGGQTAVLIEDGPELGQDVGLL